MKKGVGEILLAGILSVVLASTCLAGENVEPGNLPINGEVGEQAGRHGEWDIKLGAGMMVGPRYEGSDKYVVYPLPSVSVTWRDIISLGTDGLNVNVWRGSNYRLGAGLTYNPGRREDGADFFGTDLYGADDSLRGLGDIDAALGIRAFGSYMLGPVSFRASITKFTGEQNDGLLLNLGLSLPLHPTNRLTLAPGVGITWADDNYMETFFGVSPQQSARSGYPVFNAGAGVKDVTVGLNATYSLNRHWFVMTNAGAKLLLDDAERSPITHESASLVFSTVIGYHF
ncbi:MAG: MipA/OmpV family protein [Syntrophobacteraceae bacterium]